MLYMFYTPLHTQAHNKWHGIGERFFMSACGAHNITSIIYTHRCCIFFFIRFAQLLQDFS